MKIGIIAPNSEKPKTIALVHQFCNIFFYSDDIEWIPLTNNFFDEGGLRKIKNVDILYIEPWHHVYPKGFLTKLKQVSGKKIISRLMHPIEVWTITPQNCFNDFIPLVQSMDGYSAICYNEVSFLEHTTQKKVAYVGHSIPLNRLNMKDYDVEKKEDVIASCSTFTWGGAYQNTLVAKHFKGRLQFKDFLSANTNEETRANVDNKFYEQMNYKPEFIPFIPWGDMLKKLSKYKIAIDLNHRHNCSKFGVDCAIAGVPFITSRNLYAPSYLFPDLAIDPYDIDKAIELIGRLLSDDDFYSSCVKKARARLPYFDVEKAKERFFALAEEVLKE